MSPEVTPGNLRILDEMLTHVANDFCAGTPPAMLTHPKKSIAENLWSGVNGLKQAIPFYNGGKAYKDPVPPFPNRPYSHGGWDALVQKELRAFNRNGSAYVTRISECLIKTMGLISTIQGEDKTPQLTLYRGQHNAEWPVISSIGRKVPKGFVNARTEVSNFELQALAKWQSRIQKEPELLEEIFGQRMDKWQRMQWCVFRRAKLPLAANDGRW